MDIVNFTPLPAFIGGSLIGLSAALLMYFNGRIAGISGIAGGVILPEKGDLDWRIVFLVGLLIGGFIYQLMHNWTGIGAGVQHIEAVVGTPLLIIAGLLVGVGTTIGTGCTSGHGICGLARRSPRSFVATLTFMVTAIITVFIVRHVAGV